MSESSAMPASLAASAAEVGAASQAPSASASASAAPVDAVSPPAPGRPGWAGKWQRRNVPSKLGTLEIKDVTATGFHFELDLMSGAHQGGAEGDARFTPDGARFDASEDRGTKGAECAIRFTRKGDVIRLEQENDCIGRMGFGVHATDDYHPDGTAALHPTTFACASATSAVDRAVCRNAALAGTDLVLGAATSARLRRGVACPEGGEVERCVARAYRKHLAGQRGGAGGRFDLEAMRRAVKPMPVVGMASGKTEQRIFRTAAAAWNELDLYLVEQLPRAHAETLAALRFENEHVVMDDAGIALRSSLPFCADCAGTYLRVEARGVWLAMNGTEPVVLGPRSASGSKTPVPEPAPLTAWLADAKVESPKRVPLFE